MLRVFGLVISIPLVVLGAQLILKVIERLPVLIFAGGGLRGYLAGDLVVGDPALAGWVASRGGWPHWAGPSRGGVTVIAIARWGEQRRRARRSG